MFDKNKPADKCLICKTTGVPPVICEFFLRIIEERSQEAAEKAVSELLSHPVEMTVADIEKAFGHKIKIIN